MAKPKTKKRAPRFILIRLRAEHYDAVHAAAKSRGMTATAFARELCGTAAQEAGYEVKDWDYRKAEI